MERYYQKEIECASRDQIRAWQDERLVRQVRHVWDNVPYYRAKMEATHVAPDDMGKVIGRQGRIAKEIRTVIRSYAQRTGTKVSVDIVD